MGGSHGKWLYIFYTFAVNPGGFIFRFCFFYPYNRILAK